MKLLLHYLLSVVQPGSHLGDSTAIKHFLSLLTFFLFPRFSFISSFAFFLFPFFFPSFPCPSDSPFLLFPSALFSTLEVRPLKSSYGFRGSDVSSISGVWGITTDEIEFGAFVPKIRHLFALFWADPVFENTYFTFFFRFQKNVTFYVFLNDLSKKRKKSLAKSKQSK